MLFDAMCVKIVQQGVRNPSHETQLALGDLIESRHIIKYWLGNIESIKPCLLDERDNRFKVSRCIEYSRQSMFLCRMNELLEPITKNRFKNFHWHGQPIFVGPLIAEQHKSQITSETVAN